MTKMNLLYKAGYYVRVKSWENDGDFKTQAEVRVDTFEEATAWAEYAKLFADGDTIPNLWEPSANELADMKEEFEEFFDDHPDYEAILFPKGRPVEYWEWLYPAEMLKLSGVSEFTTRAAESLLIFHVEEDIYIKEVRNQW